MRNFHFPGRSEVYSSNAMAATSQPLATETSKTYTKLLEYVNAFVDNYSYDVCITDTV